MHLRAFLEGLGDTENDVATTLYLWGARGGALWNPVEDICRQFNYDVLIGPIYAVEFPYTPRAQSIILPAPVARYVERYNSGKVVFPCVS